MEETSRASPVPSESFSVHESAWTRVLTEDQKVYFFNRATGASQWSIPNELYNGRYLSKDLDPEEDLLIMPSAARASLGEPRSIGVDCITERPAKPPPEEEFTQEFAAEVEEEQVEEEEEYIPQGSILTIMIHSARGLRDADFMPGRDKSDPICRVEIIGKPDTQCVSHVVKDCLDPVWDYECKISGVWDGDILLFQVFDQDDYATAGGKSDDDDLLGKVMLALEEISSEPVELELEDTGFKKGERAFVTVSVSRLDLDKQREAELAQKAAELSA
mmetsp:Transcript_42560/g.75411  ORF Transcript_42560/g.75411 Transcript_42560/m.75411 type:complete len:275 (-) Transcript_42560:97-921(-)